MPMSFCTVSPSYLHNPAAIWAHILPVLEYLKKLYPHLSTLSIWSDGPTTQYRNKFNFLLFNHLTRPLFKYANWNMFEAGHGKGAADAVGGVIKRMADDKVKMGHDIQDECTLFKTLKDLTKIKMFYVKEATIKSISQIIPNNVQPVAGTMQLHQIVLDDNASMVVRNISCFCALPSRNMCACFAPRKITAIPLNPVTFDTDSIQIQENDSDDHFVPEVSKIRQTPAAKRSRKTTTAQKEEVS